MTTETKSVETLTLIPEYEMMTILDYDNDDDQILFPNDNGDKVG